MFKWSHNDKYFGRVTVGQQISIYETPGMGLVGKKSIKVEGVADFEWAPVSERDKEKDKSKDKHGDKKTREEIISFWTPEIGNQPARVTLMSIPSKEIIRTKNLFSVANVCESVFSFPSMSVTKTLILLHSFPMYGCSVSCIGSQMGISYV